MTTVGRVRLSEIKAMLADCAPGYSWKEKPHYFQVLYNGLIYPCLPKGEHGKGNPEIQRGHVKKMARFLGILECAMLKLGI